MSASARHSDIARRYATALFGLAQEQNVLEGLEKDLRTLVAAISASADFTAFAGNASLSRTAQAEGAAAVATHLGLGSLAQKFIGAVARNRRLNDLRAMAEATLEMIAAAKGETTATVVSATALDEAQAKKLATQLDKLTGLKVRLDQQVDPSLIGGVVVHVGDLRIDDSVKTKLERLHRALVTPTTATDSKKMKEVA